MDTTGPLRGPVPAIDLDAVDEQRIDDFKGIVLLLDDDPPTTLGNRHEFRMLHFKSPAIGQVQDEGLKRPLVQDLANGQCVQRAA